MLEKEFKFFTDNQDLLYGKYPNKFLVIVGDKVEKYFNEHMDAYNFGSKTFGVGNFLIQHCLPGEMATTRTFHTHILA